MGARFELQFLLVRLFAGAAFLPESFAKLFSGLAAREQLALQLAALGVAHALEFVVLSGVLELALGLMLILGFGTRLAAVLAALLLGACAYLFPSTHELLWMLVCASFAIAGGGRWSLDTWLKHDGVAAVTPR